MGKSLGSLIIGLLVLVFGVTLGPTILSAAATSGTNTNIGSFSGTKSLNDIVPLLYYTGVIFIGLGAIGLGGAGVAGRGPLARE